MLRRFLFGPGQDEPILEDPGGPIACTNGTRFLHTDHQGSIIAAADCWGNRQAINSYDEYGIPGASNWGRFQYTGQAWLGEIGMYYYKARMYSPTLGRFLQTDPIGYEDQINLYTYVGNDPVNHIDPTGTRCFSANDQTVQCRRSAFYAMLHRDKRISRRTAFFAGASIVTAALANKDIPGVSRLVSPATSGMLNRMGGMLFALNRSIAEEIRSGTMLSPTNRAANDRAMVHKEQSAVQSFLENERNNNSNYAATIAEINRMLNGAPEQWSARFADPAFSSALRETRRELGRSINFEKQSDREALGNNILENQRDHCTGTRICR